MGGGSVALSWLQFRKGVASKQSFLETCDDPPPPPRFVEGIVTNYQERGFIREPHLLAGLCWCHPYENRGHYHSIPPVLSLHFCFVL